MTIPASTNAAADAPPDSRRWIALAVIVVAQFMVVLDVAIVNVALPSIQRDLHFTQESLQWVITAYTILFGGVLLLGGRMADLLGRRRLFMAGVLLFTLSSLLDGLAWSEGSLIAFRALQGLGGALLSGGALDPHDHVPRGARAQRRARCLGCGIGHRRRGGRAARRGAHERVQLAVDLLRQRSGGSARARGQPAASA
jgi:predicted MFS family arabinose efflux permease